MKSFLNGLKHVLALLCAIAPQRAEDSDTYCHVVMLLRSCSNYASFLEFTQKVTHLSASFPTYMLRRLNRWKCIFSVFILIQQRNLFSYHSFDTDEDAHLETECSARLCLQQFFVLCLKDFSDSALLQLILCFLCALLINLFLPISQVVAATWQLAI